MEAVLLLWDHIFASLWIEGRPDVPECIESVAVAMVSACFRYHPLVAFFCRSVTVAAVRTCISAPCSYSVCARPS